MRFKTTVSSLAKTTGEHFARLFALTKKEISILTKNAYGRFKENKTGKKKAAVLFRVNTDGTVSCEQFDAGISSGECFRPVARISAVACNNDTTPNKSPKIRIYGETPGGTKLRSSRTDRIECDGIVADLAFLSQYNTPEKTKNPNTTSGDRVLGIKAHNIKEGTPPTNRALFSDDTDEVTTEVTKKFEVTAKDVEYRKAHKHRGLSQNQVMGCSAREAFARLSNIRKQAKKEKCAAPKQLKKKGSAHKMHKHHKMEWLHHRAFSLSPKNESPQIKDNLFLGTACQNTGMMPSEIVLRFLGALPGMKAIGTPTLYLDESNVVKGGSYDSSFSFNGKTVAHCLKYPLILNHA